MSLISNLFIYALNLYSLLLNWWEHVSLDLFVAHEHSDVPGCKSEEIRYETAVEREEAVLFESGANTVEDTVVLTCHHAGLGHVEGGAEDQGCKTCHSCTHYVQGDAVFHSCVLQNHLFVLIIRCDFSSIND